MEADTTSQLSAFLACQSHADLRRLRKLYSASFSFITLACKQNRADLLKLLLEDDTADGAVVDVPQWCSEEQKDDGHNAVYYSIRSSNVELLRTLIDTVHPEFLEPLISESYEELLLNNVFLSGEMQMFVQYKLIDLRFFSKGDGAPQVTSSANDNIKERIKLLLENIVDIKRYSEVDSHFLYTAKFIARSIHILKHQLKSTYNILPWEEIEFCLVSFIAANIRRQELNIFYLSVLRKDRLLKQLDKFASALQELEEYIGSTDVRKLRRSVTCSREDVAAAISSRYPDLCADYKEVRDVSSLHIMETYLHAALQADSTTRLGQLTIKRALQVTGEHMKNTLESPKLSSAMSDLILLSAPKETRKVLQGLRNSLSHPHLEFNDNQVYSNIQKDVKKIVSVITGVKNSYRAEKMKSMLTTLISSDNIDEILQIVNLRLNVSVVDVLKIQTDTKDHRNIEDLMRDLENILNNVDQTSYEKKLLAEIKEVAGKTKENLSGVNDFWIVISRMLASVPYDHGSKSFDIMIRNIKFMANVALEGFPCQKKSSGIEKINALDNLFIKFSNSILLRIKPEIAIEMIFPVLRILNALSINKDNINCIDDYSRQILSEKINKNYIVGEKCDVKSLKNSNEIIGEQLTLKLIELKNAIGTDRMSGQLFEHLSLLHKDENTNTFMVEALVLDTMSLLDNSNRFPNNMLYLDGNTPLMSGKCLRNHLAHKNALVDILPTDAWSAVLLNAVKLTENKGLSLDSKVGHILKQDIKQLRRRYKHGLYILDKQKDMWKSLLDGNFENFMLAIAGGADIYSRKENVSSTLHYAARGPNIKIVNFLMKQKFINAEGKDVDGQTALHEAAAFGREATVKFLVKEMRCAINHVDNAGKTALHLASQNGHKKTVMTLLLLGAKTMVKDVVGDDPMHYAVRNDFLDVFIILSEKNTTIDENVNRGNYSFLHIAAENDNIKMVQYLLQKEADVNAKSHLGVTPLHLATLNGHLKVVKILLEKGAHVNFRDFKGISSLHRAVEKNHEEMVNVLLEKGALVNNGDFTYNGTPFHTAVLDGNAIIVGLLLQYQANVNAVRNDGFTPLLFAVKGGHADIVDLLLQNGALMESRDIKGSTALHIAAMHGHTSVVEILILKGIGIHVQNTYKLTPLHLAAEAGHQQVVDILLAVGANVNSADDKGFTALHFSSLKDHEAISEALLKKGAKVRCINNLGYTPLHMAVTNTCNVKIIQLLLKHGANVNVKEKLCRTALHIASFAGDSPAVEALLQERAEVNAEDSSGTTALLMAASGNHKAVVEILLKYGADVNHFDNTGSSALCCAAKNNNLDILNILINNGADVNIGGGKLLFSAITAGHRHVVESLLKNKDIDINVKDHNGIKLLCAAALNGDGFIARELLKRGVEVREETQCTPDQSPLLSAIMLGHMEFVEILLESGANVNSLDPELSPLHFAIQMGLPVERLLHWGAKSNIRDSKNRLPLELAVSHSQIQNTLILLRQPGVMINEKGSDDWTLLHIAAQAGNLEITKLLVDRGADINARHNPGAKPIHIAARNGHIDILNFFLELGISINDPGCAGLTLIHYAATGGQLAVAQNLIDKHVDIESTTFFGIKPLHCSAELGHIEMLIFLLQSGAVYDAKDILGRTPSDLTKSRDIKEVLESIGKLFKAVKKNDVLMVGVLATEFAKFLNAKSSDNATLLHIACWKGFQDVCDILLKMKANPNAVGKGGYCPLHYASKYSHPEIVESLLKNGAVHDIKADNMKTPLDLATQKNIKSLLIRVALCFMKVNSRNVKVINDINKISNIEFIKAVMKARDADGNTLVVVAMKNGFTDVDKLKQVSQTNFIRDLFKVHSLLKIEHFTEAFDILKQQLNERIEILGEDNPGTLDIQLEIAVILYKQCKYFEAMPMLEDIYKKRVDVFGPHHPDSLKTRSFIALLLHRLGRDRESWNMFKEVIPRQQEALGEKHDQLLLTKIHAGLTLYGLKKYEEALQLNTEVYKIHKNDLPAYHPKILVMQNNIAIVLTAQGKLHEAFSLYQKVYEVRKLVLGLNHSDTLRARCNMAIVLMSQHKFKDALQVFQEVLALQKNVLGLNHADTVHTQRLITDLYLYQGDLFNAAKIYKAGLNARIATFGPNHPLFAELDEIQDHFQELVSIPPCDFNLLNAASDGDRGAVCSLIENGSDVNTADDVGRTALHFSAMVEITELLLNNGADATAVSQKGNTPLHLATSRGCGQTVRILLQNVKRTKPKEYFKFINAKTIVRGSTALHVAAEKGFVDIVSCFLEHGACYNIRNRSGNLTPLQCSRSPSVIKLLRLADEIYEMAGRGGTVLPRGDKRHLTAVVHSRDSENRTPLQLALVNHHTGTARLFEGLLKTLD